jgi:hypothetical protein
MTSARWSPVRGLNPTPPEARTWLRQELHGSGYQGSWFDSVSRWILEQLQKLLDGVGNRPGISPVVTALIAVIVIGLLVWILPKVRRERVVAEADRAVLEDLTITARRYRELAGQALGDERYDDAVLDGFRAIAKEMSDRTIVDDAPGRTAHEVSLALAAPFPDHADRLAGAADLFDAVRYGHRRANAEQAGQVQQLDAELVRTRPRLPASSPGNVPV